MCCWPPKASIGPAGPKSGSGFGRWRRHVYQRHAGVVNGALFGGVGMVALILAVGDESINGGEGMDHVDCAQS